MINYTKIRSFIRIFLGVLLLLISALAFFDAFYLYDYSIIFWFCYLCVPLAAIGILMSNANIIKSQLYIIAIPDLIWTIDFIYRLIVGNSLFGIVDYLFAQGDILPKIVTLQHAIIVPIMFYSLVLLKNKEKDSWKISVFQVTMVYLLTRLFTLPADNINCAYIPCGNFTFNLGIWYPLVWLAISFIMIYISRKIFMNGHRFFRKFFNLKD